MPRAHREVRDAEVEEALARLVLAERVEPLEVLFERGLKGALEQVLHGEGLREVGARGLARARGVVQVDLAAPDERFLALLARPPGAALVHRQVALGDRQLAFEEPLVDRPELAHAEAAEVHGAEPFRALDEE